MSTTMNQKQHRSYTPLTNTDDYPESLSDDNIEALSSHNRTVILLDGMQKRFELKLRGDDTLATLREKGAEVHGIPPDQQRLIFMGRLLSEKDDDETLNRLKIEDLMVIHLFPKPRIVTASVNIASNSNAKCLNVDENSESNQIPAVSGGSNSNSRARLESDEDTGNRAHIPSIMIDPSSVSGSVVQTLEIFESAQRVKMLAFILIVICGMELLKLLTDALGTLNDIEGESGSINDPGDPTDYDYIPDNETLQHKWSNVDYFDLIISFGGIYVSLLGLKASRENTVLLAKKYLLGLILTGSSWLVWDYLEQLNLEKEAQENGGEDNPVFESDKDMRQQAFAALLLPAIVWGTCFYRAWEFQHLLVEATSPGNLSVSNHQQTHDSDSHDDDFTVQEIV